MIENAGDWLVANHIHPDITRSFVTHRELDFDTYGKLVKIMDIVGRNMPPITCDQPGVKVSSDYSRRITRAENELAKTVGSKFISDPY